MPAQRFGCNQNPTILLEPIRRLASACLNIYHRHGRRRSRTFPGEGSRTLYINTRLYQNVGFVRSRHRDSKSESISLLMCVHVCVLSAHTLNGGKCWWRRKAKRWRNISTLRRFVQTNAIVSTLNVVRAQKCGLLSLFGEHSPHDDDDDDDSSFRATGMLSATQR